MNKTVFINCTNITSNYHPLVYKMTFEESIDYRSIPSNPLKGTGRIQKYLEIKSFPFYCRFDCF